MKTPASPAKLASLERARAAKAVKRAAELKAAAAPPRRADQGHQEGALHLFWAEALLLFFVEGCGGGIALLLPPQKKERQLWPCNAMQAFPLTTEKNLKKKFNNTDPCQARGEEDRPAAQEVCQEDAVAQVEREK